MLHNNSEGYYQTLALSNAHDSLNLYVQQELVKQFHTVQHQQSGNEYEDNDQRVQKVLESPYHILSVRQVVQQKVTKRHLHIASLFGYRFAMWTIQTWT